MNQFIRTNPGLAFQNSLYFPDFLDQSKMLNSSLQNLKIKEEENSQSLANWGPRPLKEELIESVKLETKIESQQPLTPSDSRLSPTYDNSVKSEQDENSKLKYEEFPFNSFGDEEEHRNKKQTSLATLIEKAETGRKRKKFFHTQPRNYWDNSEDEKLKNLVHELGPKWSKIAEEMPGRSGKQVRDRYMNYLQPGISLCEWTPLEDQLLAEAYEEFGNKWSKISERITGRTENQVKNRYYAAVRKERRKADRRLKNDKVQRIIKVEKSEKFEKVEPEIMKRVKINPESTKIVEVQVASAPYQVNQYIPNYSEISSNVVLPPQGLVQQNYGWPQLNQSAWIQYQNMALKNMQYAKFAQLNQGQFSSLPIKRAFFSQNQAVRPYPQNLQW